MLWIVSKRFLSWGSQKILALKNRDRGAWHWMEARSIPLASLNRNLWRSAESSYNYYALLFLSGAIATLGLLSNSTATVIGAMIVAPLMGPITGMAFAMVMANRRLLKRSSLSLLLGCLLTVGTATVLSHIIGIDALTPEIAARTKPTLIDLGVALAAGAVGALAKSRRGIGDALPGVAIAVALVPPLSVIGIGIAFASPSVFFGSLLLFLTNLVGIVFSGGLVFLSQSYGSLERAKRGLIIAVTTLVCLGIPLSLSFQDLVLQKRVNVTINDVVRRRALTFSEATIRSLNIQREGDTIVVDLDIEALPDSISAKQVSLVRDLLAKELDHLVTLNVNAIPIEQFSSSAPVAQKRKSFFARKFTRRVI